VVHNDDIDDRIITEISQADFLIAVLTYARPSVYFEAGYAQRAIPVIYTARADHFSASPDDHYGNLRVHFDLQMKNIIAWNPKASSAFRGRLAARVRTVVAPLVAAQHAARKKDEEATQFQRRPLAEKLRLLREGSRECLVRAGYEVTVLTPGGADDGLFPGAEHILAGSVVGQKREGGTHRVVFVDVVSSLTKARSKLYRYRLIGFPIYDLISRSVTPRPRRIQEDFVIWSLAKGGLQRLGSVLTDFGHGSLPQTLTLETVQHVRAGGHPANMPRFATFHALDSPVQFMSLEQELVRRI
jgi:hypothetical protein